MISTTALPDHQGLRRHLIASRLAGDVATSSGNALRNCARLVAGDPDCTFGLSDWQTVTLRETVAAVRALCGGDPGGAEQAGPGYIDPEATLRGLARHREVLGAHLAAGASRVLLATGHPTGLLAHYMALGRALQAAGCGLLAPLDDTWLPPIRGRRRGIRFTDGVAAVHDGADLCHTHRSDAMEAMLDALDAGAVVPDLVIGDHGMAGAAVERGIQTLSIADLNDPALPLAQARGRTDNVLVADDNLAPRVFVPLTRSVLHTQGMEEATLRHPAAGDALPPARLDS